jgi:hypothetical protein
MFYFEKMHMFASISMHLNVYEMNSNVLQQNILILNPLMLLPDYRSLLDKTPDATTSPQPMKLLLSLVILLISMPTVTFSLHSVNQETS